LYIFKDNGDLSAKLSQHQIHQMIDLAVKNDFNQVYLTLFQIIVIPHDKAVIKNQRKVMKGFMENKSVKNM